MCKKESFRKWRAVSRALRQAIPRAGAVACGAPCRYHGVMHRIITAAVAAALCTASAARAQGLSPFPKATDDLVRAELISDVASIAPGSTFRLGVHLTMKEGWHVNWTNPGDAGLAPSIKWILPPVLKAGIITWPLPARIMTGPLAIFGYAGDVLLICCLLYTSDAADERSSVDL